MKIVFTQSWTYAGHGTPLEELLKEDEFEYLWLRAGNHLDKTREFLKKALAEDRLTQGVWEVHLLELRRLGVETLPYFVWLRSVQPVRIVLCGRTQVVQWRAGTVIGRYAAPDPKSRTLQTFEALTDNGDDWLMTFSDDWYAENRLVSLDEHLKFAQSALPQTVFQQYFGNWNYLEKSEMQQFFGLLVRAQLLFDLQDYVPEPYLRQQLERVKPRTPLGIQQLITQCLRNEPPQPLRWHESPTRKQYNALLTEFNALQRESQAFKALPPSHYEAEISNLKKLHELALNGLEKQLRDDFAKTLKIKDLEISNLKKAQELALSELEKQLRDDFAKTLKNDLELAKLENQRVEAAKVLKIKALELANLEKQAREESAKPLKNNDLPVKPALKNDMPTNMVLVPAGTFEMGSNDGYDDEKPIHKVTLSSFYMSKYAVTFEEYDKYCKATKIEKPSDSGWGRGKRPVINVSWEEAVNYCTWLSRETGKSYRLPTEAEWEYAARGGQSYPYAGSDDVGAVAWYDGNSGGKTHPVGEKQANGYGLHDMSGNVWEWCSDWYSSYSSSAVSNPTGAATGSDRVLRGGSWFSLALHCRVSHRSGYAPTDRDNDLGFRVVCLSQ